MKYERAYHDDPDNWLPLGEKDLRRVFQQNFEDVDLAVKQVKDGETVRTRYARYRKRDKS